MHSKKLIMIIAACLPGVLFFSVASAYADNPGEIDQTQLWKRHLIDATVKQDQGHAIGVEDLNGDGRSDVLIVFGERNNPQPSDGIYWYEAPGNPGNENWKRCRVTAPVAPIRWCLSLTTGDIDNDGDLDVVALSFDNSNVYLALNPIKQGGDINKPWKTLVILKSPGVHRDGERVELADIDKDGYKDVVFPRGIPGERGVRILFNPSGKPAAPWTQRQIGVHESWDAHDVMTTDMDLDGDLDIVFAGGSGDMTGDVYWYEHPDGNPRSGAWIRHRVSPIEPVDTYGALQIDDVDQDGRPDILVAEAHGNPGRIMWYKNPNPPTGTWKRSIIGTHNYPHAALSFDVDGDGKNEFWVGDASHADSGKFGLRTGGIVYFKSIDKTAKQWARHRVANPPEVGRQCRAVDMDGDGDLDVISTADHKISTHTISVVWWENCCAPR